MTGSFFFSADVCKAIRENLGYSQVANRFWIEKGQTSTVESSEVQEWFKDWWCEDSALAERLYKQLECHAPQYIQIERA